MGITHRYPPLGWGQRTRKAKHEMKPRGIRGEALYPQSVADLIASPQ